MVPANVYQRCDVVVLLRTTRKKICLIGIYSINSNWVFFILPVCLTFNGLHRNSLWIQSENNRDARTQSNRHFEESQSELARSQFTSDGHSLCGAVCVPTAPNRTSILEFHAGNTGNLFNLQNFLSIEHKHWFDSWCVSWSWWWWFCFAFLLFPNNSK